MADVKTISGVTVDIPTHAALTTGTHGVGVSTIANLAQVSDAISLHDDASAHGRTNIDGVTERDTAISDHAADLDAHTRHVSEIMRTGEYIVTIPTESTDMSQTLTANTLYAAPFIVPRDLSIDYVAFRLLTGIDAKVARLGIYADGTNCYPGALVEDWGEVAVAIANQGAVAINIADRALTKGLYWLAFVANAAIAVTSSRLSPLILGQAAMFGNPQVGWSVAFTYAALPNPFTAGGSLSVTNVPLVLPRLKSLD